MAEIGVIRYFLAVIGGAISLLSGIILIVIGVFGGAISTVLVFSPAVAAGVFAGAGFLIVIVFGAIISFLSFAIINYAKELRSSSKGKLTYGFLIILFSIVLFLMGAGFGIGPIISGIAGILILL